MFARTLAAELGLGPEYLVRVLPSLASASAHAIQHFSPDLTAVDCFGDTTVLLQVAIAMAIREQLNEFASNLLASQRHIPLDPCGLPLWGCEACGCCLLQP